MFSIGRNPIRMLLVSAIIIEYSLNVVGTPSPEFVSCSLDSPLAPVYTAAYVSNSTMSVALCCSICRATQNAYCGLFEAIVCACSNSALATASTCASTCPADGLSCGDVALPATVDVYNSAASVAPNFTLTVTDAAPSMTVVTTFINPLEIFFISLSDGSPLFSHIGTYSASSPYTLTASYNKPLLPGVYSVTAIGAVTGTPISYTTASSISTLATPSIDIVSCPIVEYPNRPYLCNVSVTYQSHAHYYSLSFNDLPTAITNLTTVGSVFSTVGHLTPKGLTSEADTNGPALGSTIIFINNPITTKGTLIGIDYLPYTADVFALYVSVPYCGSQVYCIYLGICASTCPYSPNSYSFVCPGDSFCPLNDQCCTTSPTATNPTWTDILITSTTVTTVAEMQYVLPTPISVLPGYVLKVVGSLARSSQTSPGGDIVNGAATNYSHFAMMTIMEFNNVTVQHTCLTVLQNVTLDVVDTVVNTNVYAGAPAMTMCERNITSIQLGVNQSNVYSFNVSVNLQNPYYVWVDYGFDILATFPVAGPIYFNLTYTPNNGAQATVQFLNDYPAATGPYVVPISQTIITSGIFLVEVVAFNDHNTYPDQVTGIIQEGITQNITIIAQYPVSPAWTVSPNPATSFQSAFLIPRDQPSFFFKDTNSWTFPTNATLSINWGDGSLLEVDNFVNPGTGMPIIYHQYKIGNVYTIVCSITNAVSEIINFNTTVTIYEQVFNFTATNSYLPTLTSTVYRPGFGRGLNQYPMDKNLTFFPAMSFGTVDSYEIDFTTNGSKIDSYVVPNKFSPTALPLSHYFGFACTLNMTVYAINIFQTVSVDIYAELSGMVRGLQVDDYSVVTKPGALKTFEITFESLGASTCLVIDFGDLSDYLAMGDQLTCKKNFSYASYQPVLLEMTMNITHSYTSNGMYNISVLAYNAVNKENSALMFLVTNLNCSPPVAFIYGQCVDHLSAPTVFKGKQNTVVAVANLKCAITQKTKKRWQIFSVDEVTGTVLQPMDVMNVTPSWNYSSLLIPAAFLNYGYYMVLYTITMWDPPVLSVQMPFQKQVEHYMYVGATPLSTKMTHSGASQIILGLKQSIDLQPADYSIDPDFPTVKNFSITWKCRTVGESWPSSVTPLPVTIGILGTGCFGNGPGYVSNNAVSWNIFGEDFRSVGTFEMWAEVTKMTRTSPVMIQIQVVPGPVPLMMVTCSVASLCVPAPNGQGVIVNPNHRIGLIATCTEACDVPLAVTWATVNLNDSIIPLRPIDVPVGTSGMEFALGTSFFDSHPNLQNFKLAISAQNSDPAGSQTGLSAFSMIINQRPISGNCSLDMYVGRVLLDTFMLTCYGWKDPENIGIDFYVVRMKDSAGALTTLMQLAQSEATYQVMPLVLPIGVFSVEVTIQDLWGATTLFILPEQVTVRAITKQEFEAADSSALIASLLGGGNTNMLAMVAAARNSIINTAPWLDVDAPNITTAERESRMLQINSMNTQTINALQEGIPFQTPAGTEAAAGVLASIMQKASETPNSALTIDLFTRNKIYGILNNMVNQIGNMPLPTPQSLVQLINSITTIAAGLVISVHEVTTPGCQNIPPEDYIVNADHVDYDTEVKSIEMTIPTDVVTSKKCNMMDLTLQASSFNMPMLNNILEKLNSYVLQKEITGETLNVPTNNNMTTSIGILPGGKGLAGIHYCGKSWVAFPVGLCPQGSCSLPVGLGLREWPAVTYVSPSTAQLLAAGSRTFDINIYDRDGNSLPVTDSPNLINISIYRTIDKRGNTTTLQPVFVNATDETLYQKIPVMYSTFSNNKTGTSMTIEITPLTTEYDRLFVMVMKPRLPTLANHDYFTLVQDITFYSNGTYTLFLGNHFVNGTGSYYIGIGEFVENVSLSDARKLTQGIITDIQSLQKPMTVNYNLRIFSSGCYYYDNKTVSWIDAGMTTVGSEETSIECVTNHLTSYGGGLFVMPNTIDFSYVFAHMGFSDNLTIYLTIILTTSLFIIMLVWARWQDNKDTKSLGATPLPDNLANDKYLYEILVFTGNKKESQTDSTVQFVLSGEYGDTDVRTFSDSERKIFRKGGIDIFVMAVPKSLGPLSYIRFWHDNSGKGPNASWYLSYLVFKDVQTGRKFQFVCDDWFAVEKSDGQIERMLGVAGYDDKTQFGHLFSNNSNRNLSDGHLWFSIFMRPPRSRFTRCQRVGTCFSLLFLSMLVNAMWYNTVPSQPNSGGFSIGPFKLSAAQISVGFMSNLIVFPPSFLIAYFFRKARPKVLRKSRIETALEKASKAAKKAKHNDENSDEENEQQEEGREQREENSTISNKAENKKMKKKIKKKKKKFTLPWWCTYLGWVLVLVCAAASVFFLMAYGVTFGNEKATKWLTALFISFFSSVLFVQPIKVMIVAVLMSVLFKEVDLDEDDADEDEMNPELEKDQLWLYEGERSKKLGYSRVQEGLLAELRKRRLEEIEMWDILIELTGYMIFICVLFVISYGESDPQSYYLKNHLLRSFIHIGQVNGIDYTTVVATDDFWEYLPKGLLEPLRAETLYNGKPPYQLRGFLNDYTNRIMGYATIRQIRARKNTCSIAPMMSTLVHDCSGFSLLNEENRNYCAGWNVPNTLTRNTSDCQIPEFMYETATDLQNLPLWGQRDWYGGGGYVIRMSGTTQQIQERFTFLQENHWLDDMTRAVIIEYATYNTQVNLFGICTIMGEFLSGAGINPSYRFDAVSLFPSLNNFGSFVIVCYVVFCIYIFYFTIRELRLICKQRIAYFDSYWAYAEMSILLVSYSAIILYFIRDYETNKAVSVFKNTYGNGYVRMTYAVAINEYYGYAISFLIFVGTIKFIKLLRFNKRMGVLSSTLKHCWDDLIGFMMAFFICFFSFVGLFYFLLGAVIIDFCTFTGALATCFNMMMGKFQFNEIAQANPMAPVMFFVFVVCNSFVLINLLITLILDSFSEVKADIMKQSNEYEIVDFVFNQFLKFIGKQGPTPLPPSPAAEATEGETKDDVNTDVNDLPSKVDRFLAYVNDVYFDGTMDWRNKDALKGVLNPQGRQILGSEQGVGVDRLGFGNI